MTPPVEEKGVSTFDIFKDGKHVGEMQAEDARDIAGPAVERWGAGVYSIKMRREPDTCEECGGPFHPLLGCDCELEIEEWDSEP